MPEVSTILPSLRPDAVKQRIEEFAATNGNVDYEIIVVSPFILKEDRVVHIYEEKPLGTIHAHNIAYGRSSGEYIIPWSDDAVPTPKCISNMLSFVRRHKDPSVAAFRLKDREEKELALWCVYGKLVAAWGCVSKKTIQLIGGYYDTAYKGYWADPDMCLRAWSKRVKVKVCPDAWLVMDNIVDSVRTDNWNKYFAQDTETFLNRWHHKLGKGITRDDVERDWTIIVKGWYSTRQKLRRVLRYWLGLILHPKRIIRYLLGLILHPREK